MTGLLSRIMAEHALAITRAFDADRSQTVGASEIGLCARKVWYAKNEDDGACAIARDSDNDDRWGARVRGSIYEEAFWVPAMRRAFGPRLLWAGAEQRTFVKDFLSGTPDGLVIDLTAEEAVELGLPADAGCAVIDCKTADPRTRLAEAKPENVFQVQAQLGLIRELTPHRPRFGILSYTDASFWDEVKPFVVAFDERAYAAAKVRARDIMTALAAQALPPEGVIAGGKECDRCAFTAACGRQRADLVPRSEERVEMPPDLAAMAKHARELRDDADANMHDARLVEQDIRSAMAARGARKMCGTTADGRAISISWAAMNGRPSLDTKGLCAAAGAAGVDVSSFSKAGEATDRLVITLKG